jgi:transposase-like protein
MAAGSHYTDQQRREAVLQYLLLGNVEAVAKATHVPASTLRDWMTIAWWGTLSVEVRAEKGSELDGAFTRIIHEATDQLMDRLQKRDPVLVGGEIKRKPVSARDLALIGAITFDKRALSRNQPAPSSEADYTLQELAEWCKATGRAARMAGAGEGPPPHSGLRRTRP